MALRLRHVRLALVLAAGLSSSACLVVSIHPFFDEASIEMDAGLVGTWVDADGGATVVIEPGEWNSYRIAFTDRTGTQRLTGHATRIGERRFVDVLPAHGYERSELLVPLHAAFLVEAAGDALTVRELNYEWFQRAKKAGRLAAVGGVFDAKQNVLLTGPTSAIRGFLGRQRLDGFLGAATTLTRRVPAN